MSENKDIKKENKANNMEFFGPSGLQRQEVLRLLGDYERVCEGGIGSTKKGMDASGQVEMVKKLRKWMEENLSSFWGRHEEGCGHITVSGFVMDEERSGVWLVDHKKLKRWVQPGGHWNDQEGWESLIDGAVREVAEELMGIKFEGDDAANEMIRKLKKEWRVEAMPIDVDIHEVGGHWHYDIGFAMTAGPDLEIKHNEEVNGAQWVKFEDVLKNKEDFEERLSRVARKMMKGLDREIEAANDRKKSLGL